MREGVGEVDAAIAALYGLPLSEFVPARDQLARHLRAVGDRPAARRVAALRRPPVSAWAANQLARLAPETLGELLETGAALQAAQRDALAGRAGARQRGAIVRLTQRAEPLLTRAGYAASDLTLRRLAATLQAAATADEATRAALAAGRLPGDLDPAGFGLSPEAAAPPDEPAGRAAASTPAPSGKQPDTGRAEARQAAIRALERTRRGVQQATAALAQVEREATRRQQAAQAARRHAGIADELTRVADDLAAEAARAVAVADQAEQAAEAAAREAEEAAERSGSLGARHGR